jgi:hypothetical protein
MLAERLVLATVGLVVLAILGIGGYVAWMASDWFRDGAVEDW